MPICRSAQLTAFLTKFLSSVAASRISGNSSINLSSAAFLSYQARQAINEKAALLTNSSSLSDQSITFFQARGFLSNRFIHTWSQTSQESKSFTQPSICASVSFVGSSIIEASIRASAMPVRHNSSASPWSLPSLFAIPRISGTATPSLPSTDMPKRAIPSSAPGLTFFLSSFITSSTSGIFISLSIHLLPASNFNTTECVVPYYSHHSYLFISCFYFPPSPPSATPLSSRVEITQPALDNPPLFHCFLNHPVDIGYA